MDLVAAASSTSTPSTWGRSVRRRRTPMTWPATERDEDVEGEMGRRVRVLEAAVEELREEKDAAEAALRAELDAERGAAETAASETMLMIERLQREKAAALVEARQYRRLAEGRAERDRVLQDELASLSALVGDYLSLLYAHGIGPDDQETEERSGKRIAPDGDGESGTDVKGAVADRSSPSAAGKEPDYTVEIGSAAAAATKGAVAASAQECVVVVVDTAADLHARVEANREASRREVAALRAEPAQVVLAREMSRRLCRAAAAETRPGAVTTQRFSVLAICKWLVSMFLRRKKSCAARSTSGSSTALLGILLLLDRSTRRRRVTAGSYCCRDGHARIRSQSMFTCKLKSWISRGLNLFS